MAGKRGRIGIDEEGIVLAPYVWRALGMAASPSVEANMPGAYVRAQFAEAEDISLLVDGEANRGCPPSALPLLEYSIDLGPFVPLRLSELAGEYALPLLTRGAGPGPHRLDLFFRSARLEAERWSSSRYNLRICGFQVNEGARLLPAPRLGPRAIGFGDSITEGVYSALERIAEDSEYYKNIAENNARITWFPLVCAALGCEYGQLGTGGQGMLIRHAQMPPLIDTWDRYCREQSRLSEGRLVPEPDYVFCAMGTNDFIREEGGSPRHLDIGEVYLQWLASLRASCPRSLVFCIVPPLGWHADEIARAVSASRSRGDGRVHLIDTASLRQFFSEGAPTQAACDGVHPHGYGNALLGAFVAAEVRKAIGGTDAR
jgi:hypothetical protein